MEKKFLIIKLLGCLLVTGAIFTVNAKPTTTYNTFLTDDCSPSKTDNFEVPVNCKDGSSLQSTVPLIISEFRLRGRNPNGASNEFIEIYNQTNAPHIVAAADGTGYGIAASDGITRCTIPNGTVIPSRGHYLCANSVGYDLGGYATADATFTTDIPDNTGIALFNNNIGGTSYSIANRFDAVGFTSEANLIYKEGTGLSTINPTFNIDHSFVRLTIGGTSNNFDTVYPTFPFPVDNDNNTADFYFVDTNGTSAGAGQRLGAPGPENLTSPIAAIGQPVRALLDPCAALSSVPNRVRDFTSDPAQNSQFGTLDLRRTFTNNSGVPLTRLRFRFLKLTTFPAPSGIADLRPRTSTSLVVTVDRPPCGSGTSNVTVEGTTLEQPPSQPNGGGWNSTLSAGTVTLGTPLANGASIDLRFLFGVQQAGDFALAIVVEALPRGGALWIVQGSVDAPGAGRVEAENIPTAANVSVSGKVFDPYGNAISRAAVSMTDSNGATRTAKTNSFGNYQFDGIGVGATYTFNISAKGYQFSPQIVTVGDQLTDLNFTANP